MVNRKTKKEIKILKRAGKILKKTFKKVLAEAAPGVSTETLDDRAESLIKKYQAEPAFKVIGGYKWSICTPINEQVVHTPPSKRKLKKGDVLTIDIGVNLDGFNVDFAKTIKIGKEKDAKVDMFLAVGERTLDKAIKQVKAGNWIGHISKAIEEEISKAGYSVIKELTGHGIGRKLHEDPLIPGYVNKPIKKTAEIKNGMVFAIEVIYSLGSGQIMFKEDNNWSVRTKDETLSACFEKTVAVWERKTLILT